MAAVEKKVVELSFVTIVLGLWLLAAPVTFHYNQDTLMISDWIAGLLLIGFGWFSTSHRQLWAAVAVCLVGVWLEFAPLVLWAKSSSAYLNDTLIGLLAINFGLFHPGMTGLNRKGGLHNPPGWSFNPSTWSLRIPTIFLAIIAWFFSRYLSAYQLGFIPTVWDPFFGDGTRLVITSKISKMFPISDAGLGALGYTLEALLGCHGDTKRWHTMPWMVLVFGFLVVPAGLISTILIILQPVAVGAWCGLCLLTAVCMLLMILFAFSEVVATIQFLIQVRKEGKPFWHTLWHGGVLTAQDAGKRTRVKHVKRTAWGITFPWNLLASAILGGWLMLDPYLLGTLKPAADLAYILGPLLVVFSIVSCAEAARPFRYVNLLLAIVLMIGSWIVPGTSTLSLWSYNIVGVLVILLVWRRGKVIESYGTWNKYLR